jgi:hypothetical protein
LKYALDDFTILSTSDVVKAMKKSTSQGKSGTTEAKRARA